MDAAVSPPRQTGVDLRAMWPLALGFAALAIPTMLNLAEQSWSRESGAHGPIVMFTGAWLLWRQKDTFRSTAAPGPVWATVLLMVVSLAFYVFGRAYDFISLEAAGLYGVGIAILNALFGPRAILANWFPLLYLGFMVPPPTWAIDQVTAPLKHLVSVVATGALQAMGLPVVREGVTLFVAQYQLLVKDACSGMNSLIGLTAISLFYIYLLRRASPLYSLILTLCVIPIAIIANVLRIMVLVLLTYFLGDAIAQGMAHFAAGVFLFSTALLLVFSLDRFLFRIYERMGKTA